MKKVKMSERILAEPSKIQRKIVCFCLRFVYEKKNRISDVYIINKAIYYICVGKYVLLSRKIMGMEYNL